VTESINTLKKPKLPGWVSALAIAAIVKFKSVLWLGGSLITMALSVFVFAQRDGFSYAIGLVLLILIHEGGHWIWMKALGLNPKAPMFIPGLGAFVAMTNLPTSEASRAWVALAGPLIGGLGCAIMYAIGIHTHNSWLATSSNTGFMLNLMQLIPAKPLDGGFVVDVVSRWLLIPGTILMFVLAFSTGSPILYILAIFSLCSCWKSKKPNENPAPVADPTDSQPTQPTPATGWDRFFIGFAYLCLIGVLATEFIISAIEVRL
jgi:Zn-dependent protease